MKLITKKEYFDPNWEAKRLEPKTCKRWYVQLDSGEDVGPYDNSEEAAEFMKQKRVELTIEEMDTSERKQMTEMLYEYGGISGIPDDNHYQE